MTAFLFRNLRSPWVEVDEIVTRLDSRQNANSSRRQSALLYAASLHALPEIHDVPRSSDRSELLDELHGCGSLHDTQVEPAVVAQIRAAAQEAMSEDPGSSVMGLTNNQIRQAAYILLANARSTLGQGDGSACLPDILACFHLAMSTMRKVSSFSDESTVGIGPARPLECGLHMQSGASGTHSAEGGLRTGVLVLSLACTELLAVVQSNRLSRTGLRNLELSLRMFDLSFPDLRAIMEQEYCEFVDWLKNRCTLVGHRNERTAAESAKRRWDLVDAARPVLDRPWYEARVAYASIEARFHDRGADEIMWADFSWRVGRCRLRLVHAVVLVLLGESEGPHWPRDPFTQTAFVFDESTGHVRTPGDSRTARSQDLVGFYECASAVTRK